MKTKKQLIYKDDARAAVLRENPAAAHCIDRVKVVDAAEVVHGYWIEDYDTFVDANGYESEPVKLGWVCSVCKSQELSARNYCPECGAIMDGESNVKREG